MGQSEKVQWSEMKTPQPPCCSVSTVWSPDHLQAFPSPSLVGLQIRRHGPVHCHLRKQEPKVRTPSMWYAGFQLSLQQWGVWTRHRRCSSQPGPPKATRAQSSTNRNAWKLYEKLERWTFNFTKMSCSFENLKCIYMLGMCEVIRKKMYLNR